MTTRLENTDTHRWCNQCQTVKPLGEFYRNASGPLGRAHECGVCANTRNRELYWTRKYGITRAEAECILAVRGCEACGADEDLQIDHAHTGEVNVRGVLCGPCNRSLGMAEESPERLRAVADYIERRR